MVLLSFQCQPACLHGTAARKVIPFSADLHPAGLHSTTGSKIVPLPLISQPACLHGAAGCQIIPFSSVLYPTGLHLPVSTQEIPLPAVPDPACEGLSVPQIEPASVSLMPSVSQISENICSARGRLMAFVFCPGPAALHDC